MDKKIITIIVLIILLVISFSLLVSEKTKSTTQGTELQYTYLLLKPSETMDSELNDCKQILTFDENDLCVDCRFLYDFKDELRAQEQYNTYMSNHEILIESNMEPGLFNIQKNGTKVTFNTKDYRGNPKSSFLSEDNQNKYEEI